MNIDWSKAPEGATHKYPETDCFYKLVKDVWHLIYAEGESCVSASLYNGEKKPSALIERQKKQEAWDGEGLPPAGLDVEVMQGGFPSVAFDWQACKVLAINIGSDERPQVITRDFHGDVAIYYPGIDSVYFRPIKTAEQLAEEEIQAIRDEIRWQKPQLGPCPVAQLYHKGYRKQ